jgi:hypothetical protein
MKCFILVIALFIPSLSFSVETTKGNQSSVENSLHSGDYSKVFEVLKQDHIEFFLNAEVPNKDVKLRTRVYFEKNVEYDEYYMNAIEETFQLFFQWAEENNYELAINRRDHRGMSFYFMDEKSVNDPVIMSFTTLTYSVNEVATMTPVHGVYEAWHSSNGDNSLFVSHNSGRARNEIASTISHEMGHFFGDYFRVVDNYYIDESGEVEMEKLAYSFQDYCRKNSKLQ